MIFCSLSYLHIFFPFLFPFCHAFCYEPFFLIFLSVMCFSLSPANSVSSFSLYVSLHVLFQLHVRFIHFLLDLFSFSYFCPANLTPNFLLYPYITLTHSCFSSLLSDVFTMLSLPEMKPVPFFNVSHICTLVCFMLSSFLTQ